MVVSSACRGALLHSHPADPSRPRLGLPGPDWRWEACPPDAGARGGRLVTAERSCRAQWQSDRLATASRVMETLGRDTWAVMGEERSEAIGLEHRSVGAESLLREE